MGSQFRSHYIFKLLASKDAMHGIGRTVKNVILRKVKSGQLVVHSPLEVSKAVTKFVPSIHSVYLPESENIVQPEDISMARKISQTLKCSQNVVKMAILKLLDYINRLYYLLITCYIYIYIYIYMVKIPCIS